MKAVPIAMTEANLIVPSAIQDQLYMKANA